MAAQAYLSLTWSQTPKTGFLVTRLLSVLLSYPLKSFHTPDSFAGTTWLQEIVYLIHSDFDMAQAQKVMIDDRFPYLEFMYPGAKEVASYPSPRLIKSHLPYSLLPSDIHEKKPKVLNNFIIWRRVWECNNVMY